MLGLGLLGLGQVLVACAPTVNATSTDDSTSTTDDPDASSTTSPGDTAEASTTPSADDSTTAPGTTNGTSPIDTGELGCPYEACAPDEYCDEGSGECQPLPDALPECEPERITAALERPVDGPEFTRALGLANVDGVGARELVVVTRDGDVEIRTADLELLSTTSLVPGEAFDVSSAKITSREGDGFGRVFVDGGPDGTVSIFSADGAGGFDADSVEVETSLAIAVDDLDGDGDSDLVVLGNDGDVLRFTANESGFTAEPVLPIGGSPYGFAIVTGNDGRDIVVSEGTALHRLPGDGAGGFSPASTLEIGHVASSIASFQTGSSDELIAFYGADGAADFSVVDTSDVARALPVPFEYGQVFAVHGDPGSIGDVILLAGWGSSLYILVEPQFDLPCGVLVESPLILAMTTDTSVPVLATQGQLVRLSLL